MHIAVFWLDYALVHTCFQYISAQIPSSTVATDDNPRKVQSDLLVTHILRLVQLIQMVSITSCYPASSTSDQLSGQGTYEIFFTYTSFYPFSVTALHQFDESDIILACTQVMEQTKEWGPTSEEQITAYQLIIPSLTD